MVSLLPFATCYGLACFCVHLFSSLEVAGKNSVILAGSSEKREKVLHEAFSAERRGQVSELRWHFDLWFLRQAYVN